MGKGDRGKSDVESKLVRAVRERKFFASAFSQSVHPSPVALFSCLSSVALFCFLSLLVLGCGHPPSGRGSGEIETTAQKATDQQSEQRSVSFHVETVIDHLEVPWSIVWAPDGRMFFTERRGGGRSIKTASSDPNRSSPYLM
jgi:glucose/arabinose dehydrogenase